MVRLVAFSSAKEFEPYRANDFAIAYYQQTPDGDAIVMSHGGADTFPVAVHEYVHLLVRHAGFNFPPWLNEGLAEFYSTLKPRGDKILVGEIVPGRRAALLNGKWAPLAAILAAGRDSPYYNEKDKAGSLYNEGWALTHMLFLDDEYRPKFSEAIRLINSGADSQDALTRVYGKSLAQIEKDLEAYLRSANFHALLVTAKLAKAGDDLPIEPLADFDRDLMLLGLLNRPGRELTIRTALEQLMHRDPKRPEPYRQLGYLAWRQGDHNTAVQNFGKAFDLGDRDPRLLWDYARLLEGSRPEDAVPPLTELLSQDSGRMEVRLELAEIYLRLNRAKDTLATLAPVRKVTPETGTRFFRSAVRANLLAGDADTARDAAEQFRKICANEGQCAEADRLIQMASRAKTALSSDQPPRLLRRSSGDSPVPEPAGAAYQQPAMPSVSGRFVELNCKGAQPRMIVDSPDGPRVFLIDDPKRVRINQGKGAPVDLTCGPQAKPALVRVEYDPPEPAQAGIHGLVRTLNFE
jgi:tetratricopeptide (TPR) repeat protein